MFNLYSNVHRAGILQQSAHNKVAPLEGYKCCGILLFMALAYDLFMIVPLAYKGLVTPFQVVQCI